jgi:translocation and assembly module TamB
MRPGSRIFRLLAVLALVAASLAVAGWLLLRAHGERFARERVAAAIGQALQRPVALDRVALNPWLLRAHLYGLTAAGARPADPPLLRLGHARLSLAASSLWRGRLSLNVLLEDASLRLAPEPSPDSGASLRLPAIPQDLDLGPLTVRVAEVQVVRGSLVYDPSSPPRVQISGLHARARPTSAGLVLHGRADRVEVRADGGEQVFREVRADAELQADRLQIDRLTARWDEQPITIRGQVFELHTPPKLRFTVEARMDLARLAQRAGLGLPVRGTAEVSAEVRGEIGSPEIAGTIAAPTLAVGPILARQAFLRGRWADGRLTVSELRALAWDGQLGGTVTVVAARLADTTATLHLDRIALQALPPDWGLPRGLAGRVSGTATLSGDPRAWGSLRGSLDLAATGLALPGTAGRLGAGTAVLTGTFAGREGDVTRAEAAWPGVRLHAAGGLSTQGPRALRLVLDAALDQLAAALGGAPGLAGQATLRADLRGTWRRPVASGRLTVPALEAAGARLDALQAALSYADGTLRVTPADALLGQSRIVAAGTLSAPAGWAGPADGAPRGLRLRAELQAPALRLADLRPWLPAGLGASGTLRLSASVEGTPDAWRAAGRVDAERLAGPADLAVRDAQADFVLNGTALEVAALRATVADVPLRGSGRYAWAGQGQAQVSLGPAPLGRLPHVPAGLELGGTGRGELRLAVQAGTVTGAGQLALTAVSASGHPLGDGVGQVSLQADRVEATLAFPDAGVEARVAGPLDPGARWTGTLRLQEAPVQPILRGLRTGDIPGVSGRVSARVEFSIPLRAPRRTRLQASLDPLSLTLAGDTWRNAGPVLLRWDDGTLRVERLRVESRLGSLDAQGTVQAAGPLDLTVDGLVPLAILPAVSPRVRDAAGLLRLRGTVQGTPAAPRVRGAGEVREASLRLRDYPEVIRGVNAEFAVSESGLRLTRATGVLGSGRFEAHGTALLEGRRLGHYRFQVRGQELPLALAEGLQTVWDADLELVGSASRGLLQGEARLQRGSYTRDLSLLALLLRPAPGKAAGPDVPLQLRVTLTFPSELLIRTELARMPVGGRLRVEGTLDSPVLFGALEADRGRILFRQQAFEIVSARARFADPRRIDPILDVVAEAEIRRHQVTLHLSGRSQDLHVRFSASPPLPQEDLLSLVVFGVTPEEFGQTAGGIVAGEAVQLLAQELLGMRPGSGMAGFNVDVVRTGQGAGVLRVERDLTERARVVFSQELSAEGERRLRVEYQLVGPLLLSAEQNFRGSYGADLVLRMRFR